MIQLPSKFQPRFKTLAIGAAVLLIGAPTAGATMKREPRPAAEAASSGRTLRIELTLPKEPQVAAVYPLETLDGPPPNDFASRAPHGRAWRVDFGDGFAAAATTAEPAGAYSMDDEARIEQGRCHVE